MRRQDLLRPGRARDDQGARLRGEGDRAEQHVGERLAKDGAIAKKRLPLERMFFKRPNRLRYIGLEKAQFLVAAFALAHNFKRPDALNVKRVPIA